MKALHLALAALVLALLGCSTLSQGSDREPTATEVRVEPALEATATSGVEAPPAPIQPQGSPAPAPGLETLQDEWRMPVTHSVLLFELCTMMYQTHVDFADGTIDLARAQAELAEEARFLGYAMTDLTSTVPANETVAAHVSALWDAATTLAEALGPSEQSIGSDAVLTALDPTCGSLVDRQRSVWDGAQAAGLPMDAVDALASEADPLIEDLYNSTLDGR